MNYLGHCLLSGEDEKLLVGNFLGDFVNRKTYDPLPEEVKRGVDLHRFIDEFTDSHRSFKNSKRLFKEYRHYSSVMVDLYFDHLLAVDWEKHHNVPLNEYADWVYGVLEAHSEIMPTSALRVLPALRKYNWLLAYSKRDGFEDVLNGMDRRSGYKSGMGGSYQDFLKVKEGVAESFEIFLPEIKEAISQNKS